MQDKDYLQLAAQEALKARAMTWTNPLVGAVIVKDGQVLATGYHHQYGQVHAEVNALAHLAKPELADGATLYVTLEPCSHYGKQPPCCEKVAEAGIKRVVIGQLDPHKIVAGKGIKFLQEHGITTEVIGGTEYLNEAYNFFYQQQRPLVTLKYAMSLDGKLNAAGNKRTLLTGDAAQLDVQKLRCQNQAILIGANTLRIDDPQLTVRIKCLSIPPIRIILTKDANRIDFTQELFNQPGEIWLLSEQELQKELPVAVKIFTQAKWTPTKIVKLLAKYEIQSLLVEGGSQVQAEFIAADLVDQIIAYIAPKVLGGTALPVAVGQELGATSSQYELIDVKTLEQDVRISARRKQCLPE
ncbi:bifunctional diaminohydroxyphosphoribosylaminopyrimidine deaminase/5-amino-6-(5-phosphoribosylamino)uracil reductase RibD [Lactobacillus sp. ESL0681]|uniref:bifunctional diaminohydroxyphosphoribosylaminopyrimidine deaminase/5-amino-6-(5-phosphoribosylamino)uracil reductase RibD n=1 Tax=Lactobacillus sp. ESL0681 TaxID=2983211 RepID=UPI0023F846B0|nr:bifunctional diaminohydroxyphosphoribosylaminopyrimidine deaminase/5-amino-6-(5-phosphoribosylamino)uracil reductase RibD [Lactobacillus sp. ESL0681]WEV40038.1 bifunctional diaminohydroxyphosphoribosylaminopyrimidine deaminase/5-amino-6-(5-phosphoribosylamino)uracil reductase RibD [Lactobacillus sp. ESL0681]